MNTIGKGGLGEQLLEYYERLFSHFGPQKWWPGETPLEICVGAILTQNTNWKNVTRAIENLKKAELLRIDALHSLPTEELARYIRPAGYYNVKAKRLKNFIDYVWDRHQGRLDKMFEYDTEPLRDDLLSINGIGPETADSILLYGGGKPTFVIDAYTMRCLRRHNIVDDEFEYEDARRLFMENLPLDVQLYNEYHALFVALGKHYCRPKGPCCNKCPLEGK